MDIRNIQYASSAVVGATVNGGGVPDDKDELPPISPMKRTVNNTTTTTAATAAATSGTSATVSSRSGSTVYRSRATGPGNVRNDRFRLNYGFTSNLKAQPEPWVGRAYGGKDDVLAMLVFERTYQHNGESFADMVIRIVEGVYEIQRQHFVNLGLPWSYKKSQASAQEMAKLMFEMKFLPPGRGLWAMGTPIVEERKMYASLQNCAFLSTKNIDRELAAPFRTCMDLSMLGVGVGFDTEGAQCNMKIYIPSGDAEVEGSYDIFVVSDSRVGWVESLEALLLSYMLPDRRMIQFDYSFIRTKGSPLHGFGGISSGPEPLMRMHRDIRARLHKFHDEGRYFDSALITDIMNIVAICVVAGNIRRSAEIAFGRPDDETFLNLKNYEKNPDRAAFGWASNNSVLMKTGGTYDKIVDGILANGEPGIGWIDNMRGFGRMCDPPTNKDHGIMGANPCVEMGLWNHELCTLVETFISNHTSLEQYKKTLKYAFIYAKTVTLLSTHLPETNKVMLKNRRIGTSMTGVQQFVAANSIHTLKTWCDEGYRYLRKYDDRISDMFCVPRSIKITTIKPSGTVSLLAGATPGMHWPTSQNYLRRVRIDKDHQLVKRLADAGYHIERAIVCPDQNNPGKYIYDENTLVVSIPTTLGPHVTKTEENVSMWEQLEMAAFLQRYWADNQVSCTIKFDPATEGSQIKDALEYYQYSLKGISFLPKGELLDYPQLPYEKISFEEFEKQNAGLRSLGQARGPSWKPFFQKHSSTITTTTTTAASLSPSVYNHQQKQQTLATQDCMHNVSIASVTSSSSSFPVPFDEPDSSAATAAVEDHFAVPEFISFCEGDSCEIASVKATWRGHHEPKPPASSDSK